MMKKSFPMLGMGFLVIFFIFYFSYFAVFNSYHLLYQEQIQLFRFDWNYFLDFLKKPGGFSEYLGAFFVQFYISPFVGAFIVTLSGVIVFILSRIYFKRNNIKGILWSLIPVLLLITFQSDHVCSFTYTIGFTLCLAFVTRYISIRKNNFRFAAGIVGWILLYLISGSYAFIGILMGIIHEIGVLKTNDKYFKILIYILMTAIVPYTVCRFIFYIPCQQTFLTVQLAEFKTVTKYALLLLWGYYPLLAILHKGLWLINKGWFYAGWNLKTILAGTFLFFGFVVFVKINVYDLKSELFLGIDNRVQKQDWGKALELSSRYPEINPCVLSFVNLSLYKSGKLGDLLFHYPQVGISGLCPNLETDKISPFFWCNIFYHMGYLNEAYRWASETLTVHGNSPRILKQLVMVSLINGDYAVAKKYLRLFEQTFFYKKWADHYLNDIDHPELISQDREIADKRKLLIRNDFFAGSDNSFFCFTKLLENHSENRMAFEYYMASLLLSKDVNAFVSNLSRFERLGYKKLPLHFEEALIWYMGYLRKNIVPENCSIRESTIERFGAYKRDYFKYSGNPKQQAKNMFKSYGNTFWFYFHFINNSILSDKTMIAN